MANKNSDKVITLTEIDELSINYPFNIVNKPIDRVDAVGKVMGKTQYAADFQYDNTTYGAPVYSEYPHALIKNIDISEALKVKGVITVLTAIDVPGSNLFGIVIKNQQIFVKDKARYYGDVVAMVVDAVDREKNVKVSLDTSVESDLKQLLSITGIRELEIKTGQTYNPEIHELVISSDPSLVTDREQKITKIISRGLILPNGKIIKAKVSIQRRV